MWLPCKKPIQRAFEKLTKAPWIIRSATLSDSPIKKSKIAPLQERKMIDRRKLWAKGGDGGNGCSSLHRSRHDRHGKPDGGNGGRGGDVILEASPTIWDLSSLQHHVNAKRGGHGASKNKIGSRGGDKVLLVPVGTVIHLLEGEIPSVAEKGVFKDLAPWELPGTPDYGTSDSASRSTSLDRTCSDMEKADVKNECSAEACMEKPATVPEITHLSAGDSNPKSSLLSTNPKIDSQEFNFSVNVGESKTLEAESSVSEANSDWDGEEMEEKEEIQYNIAELTEPGQRIIVARGGEGGPGNLSSSKADPNELFRKQGIEENGKLSRDETNPSLGAGFPGTESVLILELKSIADVGLVGMPNAGKSTLLGALSRAKPTVGHYPFTTLRPNLGSLDYHDFSVTVADIPGLIRGAHENRGLGHAFLRHIERTKVLAYVVDLAAGSEGRKGIPPWEQLRDLVLELEFYRKGLSDRPVLVVANKIDETGAEAVLDELKRRVRAVPVFPVCAVLEEGIHELKSGLRMLVSGKMLYKLTLHGIELD